MASVEIRLYGSLRRYAPQPDAREESLISLAILEGETVDAALERVGIDRRQVSHVFVNGTLCEGGARPVRDGDRVGVFPKTMALLYV